MASKHGRKGSSKVSSTNDSFAKWCTSSVVARKNASSARYLYDCCPDPQVMPVSPPVSRGTQDESKVLVTLCWRWRGCEQRHLESKVVLILLMVGDRKLLCSPAPKQACNKATVRVDKQKLRGRGCERQPNGTSRCSQALLPSEKTLGGASKRRVVIRTKQHQQRRT